MEPDWIHSLWIRHHCTLNDPSYHQFRDLLILLRNEHGLNQGRLLALHAATLLLIAQKVEQLFAASRIFKAHLHFYLSFSRKRVFCTDWSIV